MNDFKTTILGSLIAIAVAIKPLLETGEIDWLQVSIAGLIGLFSYFSKDIDNKRKV